MKLLHNIGEKINSIRITPLELSEDLNSRAQIRAVEVDANFSHDGWERSFASSGCSQFGENLVEGFSNNKQRFKALSESPKHLENMINPMFDTVGFGFYNNKIVILFCRDYVRHIKL